MGKRLEEEERGEAGEIAVGIGEAIYRERRVKIGNKK